jgi:hypothetical protein
MGVDIAGGYDDTKKRLILSFSEFDFGAHFDPLPDPEPCRNHGQPRIAR